jgi:hypothetical protein
MQEGWNLKLIVVGGMGARLDNNGSLLFRVKEIARFQLLRKDQRTC